MQRFKSKAPISNEEEGSTEPSHFRHAGELSWSQNNDLLNFYINRHLMPEWLVNCEEHQYIFSYQNGSFTQVTDFENAALRAESHLGQTEKEIKGNVIPAYAYINLIRAKLFVIRNGVLTVTAKGKLLLSIAKSGFNAREKWILFLLLTLDSHYHFRLNDVVNNVNDFYRQLRFAGYTRAELFADIGAFLPIREHSFENAFSMDFLIIGTLFFDKEFLIKYRNASLEAKMRLHNYILKNYLDGSHQCVLSYRFRKSESSMQRALLESAKTLYFLDNLFASYPSSVGKMADIILTSYNDIFKINVKKLFHFIMENEHIFTMIYINVFGKPEEIYEESDFNRLYGNRTESLSDREVLNLLNETFDYTTSETVSLMGRISILFSTYSKQDADYHCLLDSVYDCRYFTGAGSGRNYLENHMLIPRTFATEFDRSIEILANYIPLCPYCHKRLHLAQPQARAEILEHLFILRKDALTNAGIRIDLNKLMTMYGLDEV